MANRIALGKANNGSSDIYGLWISKPAISGGFDGNVINGSGVLCDDEDMLFDSRKGKFASVLANQDGTGSAQSVTVPAGKRPMLPTGVNESNIKLSGATVAELLTEGTASLLVFDTLNPYFAVPLSVPNLPNATLLDIMNSLLLYLTTHILHH